MYAKDQIIRQTEKENDKARVFTFGLGNDCDRDLCERVAQAGRGSCSLVRDGAVDLNAKVIKAL